MTSRRDVMNRLGRAMAEPTRSRILLTLLDGLAYPAALADSLGLTRQNISNHLACLRDCGIVVAEPGGRQNRYEITDPHLTAALENLLSVTLAVDESAECMDPACPMYSWASSTKSESGVRPSPVVWAASYSSPTASTSVRRARALEVARVRSLP